MRQGHEVMGFGRTIRPIPSFDVSFDRCSIHDCDDGNDIIRLSACTAFWNGEELRQGTHRFDHERWVG